MNNYLLGKQLSFSKNIECCREVIFDYIKIKKQS